MKTDHQNIRIDFFSGNGRLSLAFSVALLLAAGLARAQQVDAPQTYIPQMLPTASATGQALPRTESVPDRPIRQVAAADETALSGENSEYRSRDKKLGLRVARIETRGKIPTDHDQIWREYDLTPYTKGRTFPANTTNPEQTIVEWILRQNGLQNGMKTWHSTPFGALAADSEKLYVHHTTEVQMEVADTVDRFLMQRFANDRCAIRVISLSKPDWIAKGHRFLHPATIHTPGVQGWIADREGIQYLLQDWGRRTDFRELSSPQLMIYNGIKHYIEHTKQRTYLRNVQSNAGAPGGYAEDRATIDEGFAVSFTPLSRTDGLYVEAHIKLDIVQVEKMIPTMIDVPTAMNPRQRVQIESPQVSCFKLDEQVFWPKGKILILDLGSVPLPNISQQDEGTTVFGNIAKGLGATSRGNILLLIESVSDGAGIPAPVQSAPIQSTPAVGTGNWTGVR